MLKQLEKVATLPIIRLGMRLYLHTMVRKSELQDATWDEVDFENAVWTNSRPILVVENGQELVGLAFVTCAGDAPSPFAVVEDLVVDASQRGSGLGKAILDGIASEALARNCRRLFVESGKKTSERTASLGARVLRPHPS